MLFRSDHVVFQTKADLVGAIQDAGATSVAPLQPCVACIDGRYPTALTGKDEFVRSRREVHG